jgi:hypothetical protein
MTIRFKNSYEQLSLKDYLMIKEIFINTDNDKLDREIQLLELLKIGDGDINNIPVNELYRATSVTKFLLKEPPVLDVIPNYLKIGNRFYKFDKVIFKYRAGRYLDLLKLTEDKDRIWDNIHLILAILLRPKGLFQFKKYGKYDIHKEGEFILNHIKCVDAFSIANFFFLLLVEFINLTKTYSE